MFASADTILKIQFTTLTTPHNIRLWNYVDRLEDTGVLEAWKENLQDPDLPSVKCELELFYHSNTNKQNSSEQKVKQEIEDMQGTFISRAVIPEIKYHAILASLPRASVEAIISGNRNISIVNSDGIMYIRTFGQNVYVPKDNAFESSIEMSSTDNIIDESIIALFDGLPQENHPYLTGRLNIDDPDGYTAQYVVPARKHGTSMASIIIHGDLSNSKRALLRKLYVRPIMKAKSWVNNDWIEETPDDVLLVDKIHVAVRRLFEDDAGKVAPTIRIINLSIGNEYRQFDRLMSPLARLLDWLSYKYRILFVVSAGNHPNNIDLDVAFTDFYQKNLGERDKLLVEYINETSRLRRLLSPAESISALTVGALFEDSADFTENTNFILPCSDGMLSPISALGMGMNKAIKPDIVYGGGRKFIVAKVDTAPPFNSTVGRWPATTTNPPGTLSAKPTDIAGGANKTIYSFGTSNAAALISHESERCYDTLIDVFQQSGRDVPHGHVALLVKAMLIHGSEWGDLGEKISTIFEWQGRSSADKLHRYIGYGKPNIDRAIECVKNRVTLIGYGELSDGEAELYHLPLPFDFSTRASCRRLTATLTFFPPINPSRQHYRKAEVWYSINEEENKGLLQSRINADDKAVTRGTTQHEIFENDDVIVWEDDGTFKIRVNCRVTNKDEKLGDEKIPYALMVSFEIKDDIEVDVYSKVAERVRLRTTPTIT